MTAASVTKEVTEELLGTWLVQAGLVLSMLGMLAFFRTPLLAAIGFSF